MPRIKPKHIITRSCLLLVLSAASCRSIAPLPPANLAEPGWTVHHGQAVWHLPFSRGELAGDLILATRADGRSFVQFSKTPFPLVTGQLFADSWEIEFPPKNKRYAGRGTPPGQLIWLHLPQVFAGRPPPGHWSWHQDASGWRLTNSTNGESLEGFFEP
jgi:hypothetical protein